MNEDNKNIKNELINMLTEVMAKTAKQLGDTRSEFTFKLKLFTENIMKDTLEYCERNVKQIEKDPLEKNIIENKTDFTPCLNILEQLENAYNDIVTGDKNEE